MIINIKISMLAIALIVIAIVHHGSAKKCERLLTSGGLFKSGKQKAFQNFRAAYNSISPTQLEKIFKIISTDHVDKQNKNKLTQALMRAYSMELLSQNKLSMEHVADAFVWCEIKVNDEVHHKKIVPSDKFKAQIDICHVYTFAYFLESVVDNNEIISKEDMFKIMYEKFSQGDILADIEFRKKDHPDEAYNIGNYSLEYFDYVAEDYLMINVDPNMAKFSSVEEFCKVKGIKVMETGSKIKGECSH